ncbi:hypothetical protein QWY84_02720 [Aquisalimonas lutea]|uniref:hypothetical protein n=1 Tax=Aquisalimonas lutea TaxID=1327750 RepID=UPI0025B562F2|nr:hypothetical protein [Aquisalimonas lutea]MDN3516514.1 hypothetical protein [Aquisalimonas lutea]
MNQAHEAKAMITNTQQSVRENRILSASPDGTSRHPPRPLRIITRAADAFHRMRRRARLRRDLERIDDRIARDIGIPRYELEREAAKPFWRK